MVMVRRLIGGYAGEVAEMEWRHAVNAQANGAVEILDNLPGRVVSVADDGAPRTVFVDESGIERPAIDQDEPVPQPKAPAAIPRVPLRVPPNAGTSGKR